MNIVTALEQLAVEDMEGGHDQVIETVLSKLFIRGERVHKAYKHRSADFADLTRKDVRRSYIAEDFFWNNIMAPEIYLELRHVRREKERFIHVDKEEAEDWYILMKKIDTANDLLRKLETGTTAKHELALYTKTLTTRLRTLTDARGTELESHFVKGTAHVTSEVLGVCDWAYTATPYLTTADVDRAKTLLERALQTESYFTEAIELSVVTDTNPENIIFLDEGVSFIDVMPPRDTWRVHDPYFPLCRTSADVSALACACDADILHESYAKVRGVPLPPPLVRMVYETAAALIQVPYRKMIDQDALAIKYAQFVKTRMGDLAQVLDGVSG